MEPTASILWWLTAFAGAIMAITLLRSIGQCSVAIASGLVEVRRAAEEKLREENAAAEAAGRAAALEPLNLNSDGSIEEPILGVAETPSS